MMKYKGVAISGKICSGKETLLNIFKKHLGSDLVSGLAFADKLKIFAKYLLVKLSTDKDNAVFEVSVMMRQQLFKNEVPLEFILPKIQALAQAPHTLEFVKPELRMPKVEESDTGLNLPNKDFGFNNIDQLLWFDCQKPRKMLQEIGTECMRSIRDTVWIDYAFSVAEKHPELFHCLTDCRFPNEIEHCKAHGFLDIRLEALDDIRRERGLNRDGQDYAQMFAHPSETSLDGYPFSIVLTNNGTPDELEAQVLAVPVLAELCSSKTFSE